MPDPQYASCGVFRWQTTTGDEASVWIQVVLDVIPATDVISQSLDISQFSLPVLSFGFRDDQLGAHSAFEFYGRHCSFGFGVFDLTISLSIRWLAGLGGFSVDVRQNET